MPVVYIDILLAVNWFIDTLLLSATARVLRVTPKRFRIVLGGLLGGITGCALFLIPLPTVYVLAFHAVFATLMVLVSFPRCRWRTLILRTAVLYCLSGLFSGTVTALRFITGSDLLFGHNGVVYVDISPLTIALLASVSYGIVCLYEHITRKRAPENHEFELHIRDENGDCVCHALYDTGLHVTEPFSGRPVVIVERSALQHCMKAELYDALDGRVATVGGEYRRVRMIPYRSVGAEGILSGFVPQTMEIHSPNGERIDISGTYVAAATGICRDGYEALIGSDCFGKG